MKVKFTIRNNPETLEADLERVKTLATALAGLTDPKTGEAPKLWIGKSSIEVIGSSKVRAEAKSRLEPVLTANPELGRFE
jgi:hypothetical protein